jgi:hypothetical protein
MLERRELMLKIVCGLAAAFALYRLGLVLVHINPLYHVTIPALPSLASATNSASSKGATNVVAKTINTSSQASTNKSTNAGPRTAVAATTNIAEKAQATVAQRTNRPSPGTNQLVLATNALGQASNTVVQATNATPNPGKSITNSVDVPQIAIGSAPPPGIRSRPGRGMPPGFPGGGPGGMPGMPGMATQGPPLPPEMQARIDKIIESEILAPVMHPMPAALMGIAGKDVFIRASNGQTGLVKEGDEMGGIKVIRVVVNRVLIEEQGQRKELTIFSGLGSESLLSTKTDSPK